MSRQIKSIPHSVLLGPVLLVLVACSNQTATWERIRESGRLRIGLDPTYPPFEVTEGGPPRGLDVDLAEEIAADLGLQTEYAYFGYDGLYDALATEQVDVLISALVIMPERLKDFSYSVGYFNAGQVLISTKEQPIGDEEELVDSRIAVELGAEGHVVATTWQRRIPGLEVVPYNTPEEIVISVAEGRTQAAILDAIGARTLLRDHQNLQVAAKSVTDEPYALVVRAEDEVLLEKLNESLQRIRISGRLDRIVSTWLDK